MQDQSKEEAHVTIFGEEVACGSGDCTVDRAEHKAGRVKRKEEGNGRVCAECRGGFVWGMVVFMAGSVLLLNTLGIIGWEFWQFVWPFWPALLVVMGARIVLGSGFVSRVVSGILTLSVFFLIIVYGLLRVNSPIVDVFPQEVINLVEQINQTN